MARPIALDESLLETLAQALQDGASNGSAAALMGVSRMTYHRWLLAGERDVEAGEDTPHARLWSVHIQARGAAKRTAETQVFKDNPLAWLTKGPGRDEWSDHVAIDANVQAEVTADVRQQVFVDVRAPWELEQDPQWAEVSKQAYAWLKENDLLLVDESDEEDSEA